MKKTLFAAAFALTLAGGSAALQSPGLANPARLDPALTGWGAGTQIMAPSPPPRRRTRPSPWSTRSPRSRRNTRNIMISRRRPI